jgi:hypothetical protein
VKKQTNILSSNGLWIQINLVLCLFSEILLKYFSGKLKIKLSRLKHTFTYYTPKKSYLVPHFFVKKNSTKTKDQLYFFKNL